MLSNMTPIPPSRKKNCKYSASRRPINCKSHCSAKKNNCPYRNFSLKKNVKIFKEQGTWNKSKIEHAKQIEKQLKKRIFSGRELYLLKLKKVQTPFATPTSSSVQDRSIFIFLWPPFYFKLNINFSICIIKISHLH